MSLINQMLRDLESRENRGAAAAEPLPAGLAPPVRRNGRGWRLAAGVGLGLLVLLVLGLGLRHYLGTLSMVSAPRVDTAPVLAEAPTQVTDAALPPDGAAAAAPEGPEHGQEEGQQAGAVEPVPAVAASTSAASAEPEVAARPEPAPATVEKPGPAPAQPAPPEAEASAEASGPVRLSRSAPQLSPAEQAAAHYREALGRLNAGDARGAEASLRNALAEDATHRDARQTLASLLIGTGRAPEGEALLADGLSRQPDNAELRMLLARSQVARGEVETAIGVLEAGTAATPDYRAFLGALYQRVSRHTAAIGEYRQALAANPAMPAWWAGLGISLEAEGRGGEAAEAYRRALRLPGLSAGLEQYIRGRLAASGLEGNR
ncbi:MAG: tetratricopeptide repeat protein [Chromatiales bacterium]|nr:tetratricopeptide repeat protein [Chromatiales bacterium]